MEAWHIELLGPLHVMRGENVLTPFRRRKAGAVLAMLARSPVPVATSVLLDNFWPGSEANSPFTHLAMCLQCLRKALGQEAILTGQSCYRLAPGAFTTDIQRYETELHRAGQQSQPAPRIAALYRAVEMHRGAFLENYNDPQGALGWIETERAYWHIIQLTALLELTEALEQADNARAASEIALRALQLAPDSPAAQQAVLRLSATYGMEAFAKELKRRQETENETETPRDDALLAWERKLRRKGKRLTLREENAFQHAVRARFETLPEKQQQALARLTVFPATFTRAQAEAIAEVAPRNLDALETSLLVTRENDSNPDALRYALLAPVRAFASEILIPHRRKALNKRHVRFFTPYLCTLLSKSLPYSPSWDAEAPNAAQARAWILDQTAPKELARYSSFLFQVAPRMLPDMVQETCALAERLLTDETLPPQQRLNLCCDIHHFALHARQFPLAERMLRESLTLACILRSTALEKNALAGLPIVLHHAGRTGQAARLMRELLELFQQNDPDYPASCTGMFRDHAEILLSLGEYAGARAVAEQEVAIRRERGSRAVLAPALYQLGNALDRLGRHEEALTIWNEALRYFREAADQHGMADCLQRIGKVRAVQGMTEEGKQLVEQAIILYEQNNSPHSRAACLGTLGDIYLREKDTNTARRLYCEGLAYWRSDGHAHWMHRFEERLLGLPA